MAGKHQLCVKERDHFLTRGHALSSPMNLGQQNLPVRATVG